MPFLALAAAIIVVVWEQSHTVAIGITGATLLCLGLLSYGRRSIRLYALLEALRFPSRAVDVASFIVGRRRGHLRGEWAAILAGDPESGRLLLNPVQVRLAFGFIWAAVRMRVRDLCTPLWRPLDWVLRIEQRTNTLIALVVGAQAVYIVGDDGLAALVTEIWEPCGILGGAMYVLARWLRRVRGIELTAVRSEPPPGE
ncbi:hypothetical protein AB0Q95_07755 [Streptomyces sp. NPDC059900]|uniref:hypothetical protein n=1 Tax=Streptomyces sp. NPDC059900 TaxID=3155816 RepID=UPI0034164BE2